MTIYPIYIANFVLLVCYTAALWSICKSNAKLQGMCLLAWAYTAALGSAVIATAGSIDDNWLLHTISATLLLVAFILLHYSFLNFVNRRPQRPWGWVALLTFGFAVFLYCSLDPGRVLLRLQINALLVGFQAGLSAYVLLRYAEKSLRISSRAIALVFVLFTVRSLIRAVWIHHYQVMPESLSGRWAEIAGVSGYLLVNAFTPLGYLWMATTRLQSELESLSLTDALTGTLNRRALDEKGRAEVERSRRYQLPMSVLAMDLDHFKSLNDSRGHAGGDRVLITIADAMRSLLRSSDHLGRFGGDEFLILLPATDSGGAFELAERLRERIEAIAVEFQGESIEVHASFGVATIAAPQPHQRDGETWEQLQQQADAALYRAKERGRNRVEPADDIMVML